MTEMGWQVACPLSGGLRAKRTLLVWQSWGRQRSGCFWRDNRQSKPIGLRPVPDVQRLAIWGFDASAFALADYVLQRRGRRVFLVGADTSIHVNPTG